MLGNPPGWFSLEWATTCSPVCWIQQGKFDRGMMANVTSWTTVNNSVVVIESRDRCTLFIFFSALRKEWLRGIVLKFVLYRRIDPIVLLYNRWPGFFGNPRGLGISCNHFWTKGMKFDLITSASFNWILMSVKSALYRLFCDYYTFLLFIDSPRNWVWSRGD